MSKHIQINIKSNLFRAPNHKQNLPQRAIWSVVVTLESATLLGPPSKQLNPLLPSELPKFFMIYFQQSVLNIYVPK